VQAVVNPAAATAAVTARTDLTPQRAAAATALFAAALACFAA
jgi:hypothetical protein